MYESTLRGVAAFAAVTAARGNLRGKIVDRAFDEPRHLGGTLEGLIEFFLGYVFLILGHVKMALQLGCRAMGDLIEVAFVLEGEPAMRLLPR